MKSAAALLVLLGSIASTCQATEPAPPTPGTGETLLFYRAQPNGAAGNLYRMDADGKNVMQVGRSGSRPDHYPNWSPDGRSIAFESYRKGGWRIWIMNADGSAARRVMSERSGVGSYEFDPAFSSDGKQVLFSSRGDLFQVGTDGKQVQQLTRTPDLFEFSPQQSPDGRMLLFCAADDHGVRIMVAKADGTERRSLSSGDSIDYAPTWSPDGKQIAFYSDRTGSFELFLMDPGGEGARPVMKPAQRQAAGFQPAAFVDAWDNDWGSVIQYKASFSCDGKRLAFSRDLSGNREIFVVGTDGSGLRRLTNNKLHDGFPMWAPCRQ